MALELHSSADRPQSFGGMIRISRTILEPLCPMRGLHSALLLIVSCPNHMIIIMTRDVTERTALQHERLYMIDPGY